MADALINVARTLYGNTIVRFPLHHSQFGWFGIGKVLRISKGEEADLVYVAFYPTGKGEMVDPTMVIVGGNHPRRQLLTLKRGQYAAFYGRCIKVWNEIEINGKKATKGVWQFYAYALQGWYVPTMFDVRQSKKDNVDETLFTEMSENETNFLNDIIDNLFENKGEDENE